MELHKVKTGEEKFRDKSKSNRSDNPFRSFRNSSDDRGSRYSRDDRGSRHSSDDRGSRYSRDDRGSRYSRDDRRVESTTVTCADCGTECTVPFVPRTDRPVYCSECFRKNKPQDSGNDRYSRDDRGSRYSRDRGSRSRRDDFRSKTSTKIKSLKKQETFYSGGSDKFYNTLKEKLFEILGGKVCSSCGFKDERALGFGQISDEDTFDDVRRGGFASSWGKYISDPELARNEIRILCLNCNELKKPISTPEKKTNDLEKKKNRFPR
jgi:CxxC-x17-CxxC domain-containing protein